MVQVDRVRFAFPDPGISHSPSLSKPQRFWARATRWDHRLLTHKSFKTNRWVRVCLVLLGAVHSGSPLFWVGLHRLHHTRSDSDDDPHSPIHGFWWAIPVGSWVAGTGEWRSLLHCLALASSMLPLLLSEMRA